MKDGGPLSETPPYSGTHGSCLTVSPATAATIGQYSVQISNPCGMVTSNSAGLTLAPGAPSSSVSPPSLFRCPGTSATFTVTPMGSATSFQWRKDGTPLSNTPPYSGVNTAQLTIDPVSASEAGAYDCLVGNNCPPPAPSSNAGQLSVGPLPPFIIDQPASVSPCPNQTADFCVNAGGGEPLSYQWSFNGVDLTNTPPYSGVTLACLHISSVSAAQVGVYRVRITNACSPPSGLTSDPATLSLSQSPPQITFQPVSQRPCPGGVTTLTIAASGSPPLSYRWRKEQIPLIDGGPFSGTGTPTLAIIANTPLVNGCYDCVVTNGCGSDTSGVATVVTCYANCDCSQATTPQDPILTVNDFICFQARFAAGDPRANCDGSTTPPVLNVNDFTCFTNMFAAGCPFTGVCP
jgi:hypothetical protein